ncbi:hypothetical protein PTKIN_Ptkin06aG0005500 [Pterospermum kingtungense]
MSPVCHNSPKADETMSTERSTQPRRASLHRRSISDTFTLVVKACLGQEAGAVSFQSSNGAEGCFKLNGGDSGVSSSVLSLIIENHSPTEPLKWGRSFDPNMDHKKIKRPPLENRVSAQKSWRLIMSEDEYIEKLKTDINNVEARILGIAQQVALYERQNMMLRNENNEMKRKIEIIMKENEKKRAVYHALKDERDMLALTYSQMNEGN